MAVPFESLYQKVEIVLSGKIEEFQYCGYKAITKEQLWLYCIEKKWRKKTVGELHLYEIVATIYNAVASDLLNYTQIKTLKNTIIHAPLSDEELALLLSPLKDRA